MMHLIPLCSPTAQSQTNKATRVLEKEGRIRKAPPYEKMGASIGIMMKMAPAGEVLGRGREDLRGSVRCRRPAARYDGGEGPRPW